MSSEKTGVEADAARGRDWAENKTGYFGVHHHPCRSKPFKVELKRGGMKMSLGCFATAEEAALCVARSPEGRAAVKRAAAALTAAPPLTSEEARQQAQAEELTLLVADNKTGYFGVRLPKPGQPKPYQAEVRRGGKGVYLTKPGQPKPYQARVSRGGKYAHLGCFATAEEAALCVARTPEGQAVVEKAAAAPPLTSKEAQHQARDTIIGAVALDIIYEAARAATAELSAEVAAEMMAGIALSL